jgi:hypothetical protein
MRRDDDRVDVKYADFEKSTIVTRECVKHLDQFADAVEQAEKEAKQEAELGPMKVQKERKWMYSKGGKVVTRSSGKTSPQVDPDGPASTLKNEFQFDQAFCVSNAVLRSLPQDLLPQDFDERAAVIEQMHSKLKVDTNGMAYISDIPLAKDATFLGARSTMTPRTSTSFRRLRGPTTSPPIGSIVWLSSQTT